MRRLRHLVLGLVLLSGCNGEPLAPGEVDFFGTWRVSSVSTYGGATEPVITGADRCEVKDASFTIERKEGERWLGYLGANGRVECEADGESLGGYALFPNEAIQLTHDANGVRIMTVDGLIPLFSAGVVESESRIGLSHEDANGARYEWHAIRIS